MKVGGTGTFQHEKGARKAADRTLITEGVCADQCKKGGGQFPPNGKGKGGNRQKLG